jgi:hypothetical protein
VLTGLEEIVGKKSQKVKKTYFHADFKSVDEDGASNLKKAFDGFKIGMKFFAF